MAHVLPPSPDAMRLSVRRRLSAGLEYLGDGEADVRVWAPACRTVDVVVERHGRPRPLLRDDAGFFHGTLGDVWPGDRYWFRLDGDRLRSDPVSRFQPDGPRGPSAVVDPGTFRWTDRGWGGVSATGQVLYEMHVGTFTPEGTWAAAAGQLEELAALGITVIEMMPIADFAGRFGWGYDGVNLYAPTRLYGAPDDLRAFVDRAHALGIGVILDVVYNHLGPDGNYLMEFSPDYFTDRYQNDWGQALNFEGPPPARSFFVENAGYWIDEFHFDGLRLDATQDVHDASPEHVLAAITRRARAAAGDRSVYLIAENEPQDTRNIRSIETGGFGMDAAWNDDYHHAARVALTGRREAYYTDYTGSPQELVSCARHGYLYQGQWYAWQRKPRGTPARDLTGTSFVVYLENHDQVANTAYGQRLSQSTCPACLRALTALTLLGPATPLLFQGQEFGSSRPFLYFADHREDLRESIREGRREFLSQFPSMADPLVQMSLPAPDDEETFRACKLDFSERERHAHWYKLHKDLLALRRSDRTLAEAGRRRVDGAVLGPEAFAIRFDGKNGDDRLLVVNLGPDLDPSAIPEPLLAPPRESGWVLQWSSEAPQYGGTGRPPFSMAGAWRLPGHSAMLLRPQPCGDAFPGPG
ncbi:MAG TPA: malto-oligosyltrehalose trehalohydrolase [Vicinamibacterales bacterium]|nr:malto-oligosyltrehalose trehalohydrolase [Vicinamibacterales bacterium]